MPQMSPMKWTILSILPLTVIKMNPTKTMKNSKYNKKQKMTMMKMEWLW